MAEKNWTGFDVGPNGVRGVPRNATCLYNWGRKQGTVDVEEFFIFGQEDLLEEEVDRLLGFSGMGHSRTAISQEFLCGGFSIITPRKI